MTHRRKVIVFEKIKYGDSPLLLDLRAAPQDRAFVELDVDDAGIAHG
jgi:hypothetical protein